MCGIVGYVGNRRAAPLLLGALKKLEYRGYDSAGIALLTDEIAVKKCTGSVSGLSGALQMAGTCGIGHTRWATHGAPSEQNAHPHVWKRFAVVHNGIIENYKTLRAECEQRGETFYSETDSEVIAHLLEFYFQGDLIAALQRVCSRLSGSYALAVICTKCPGTVALARMRSPLVVGVGGGVWCASDMPAIAAKNRTYYTLADGEFALLSARAVFYDGEGRVIQKKPAACDAEDCIPVKKGYRHYMRKEIGETASVLENRSRMLRAWTSPAVRQALGEARRLSFVACGTAYHACLAAKCAFEALARVPCSVTVASEYRYADPILEKGELVIAVSQSGETADTIAAAELAKQRGAGVLAVVNVTDSTLAEMADHVLSVEAGREIAVAATKSFNAQLMLLYSLAATLAEAKGKRGYGDLLKELPSLASQTVSVGEGVRAWVAYFMSASSVYFIGRGADHVAALEGSLKLKEITYIPSEGYPAGELKHGTLALVEQGTPVVAVLTSERLAQKTMNAVHEVYARGARVFLVTSLAEQARSRELTGAVVIPECGEIFSPMLSVIPLQLLAYYVSVARGINPDRPRNLAKSVTVE